MIPLAPLTVNQSWICVTGSREETCAWAEYKGESQPETPDPGTEEMRPGSAWIMQTGQIKYLLSQAEMV